MSIALDKRSKELRSLIVRGLKGGNRGHVGSSMSLVEILRVLYDDILRFDPQNENWTARDRCILSKGHGCLALYAILADKGYFSADNLDSFCHFNGILGGHPEAEKVPGVEASTGALGHGLPIGVGVALAARMKKEDFNVFVIMGDGEINEGSIWESAFSASKHQLHNLTVIIDYNKIQSAGFTSEILELEPLKEKWNSFGFQTQEVNGHDVLKLKSVLELKGQEIRGPRAIICHTIKGKGIDFAENNPKWHHHSKFEKSILEEMYTCLGSDK